MDPYIQFAELIDKTFHTDMGPQTEDRAFVKIFKRLLTPEEAALPLSMSDSYLSAGEIAEKAGKPTEHVADMLHDLARRGFIFEYYVAGIPYYKLMSFTPGIFEAITSEALDKEIASYITDYIHEIEDYNAKNAKRIISSGFKIRTETYHSTLEEIRLFLDKTDIYAVTDCLCRNVHKLRGHPCGHPIEDMCVQTGVYAEYFIHNGHSRRVSREEVMDIFERADTAGLYHEIYPIDYENGCAFICNCCKCGCLVLRASGRERAVPYAKNTISINPSLCQSCGSCFQECPEAAIYKDDDTGKYLVDEDLCFDCGLCVLVCHSGAIS